MMCFPAVALSITCALLAQVAHQSALVDIQAAEEGIQSFDIRVEVVREFPAGFSKTANGPLEPAAPQRMSYRQAWRRDGRRRTEETRRGELSTLRVSDVEVQRSLDPKRINLTIGRTTAPYLPFGEDYLTFFSTVFGVTKYTDILQERLDQLSVSEETENGASLLVIDAPPGEGPSLRSDRFRIWFDRERGLLPQRIETWVSRDGPERLSRKLTINRFQALPDGNWAPVEVHFLGFDTQSDSPTLGKPLNDFLAKVDVSRSTWNQPLSDDVFALDVPEGTQVVDFVSGTQYVVGKATTTAQALDALAAQAREKPTKVSGGPVEEESFHVRHRVALLVVVNVAIVAALLAVLRYRFRSG